MPRRQKGACWFGKDEKRKTHDFETAIDRSLSKSMLGSSFETPFGAVLRACNRTSDSDQRASNKVKKRRMEKKRTSSAP